MVILNQFDFQLLYVIDYWRWCLAVWPLYYQGGWEGTAVRIRSSEPGQFHDSSRHAWFRDGSLPLAPTAIHNHNNTHTTTNNDDSNIIVPPSLLGGSNLFTALTTVLSFHGMSSEFASRTR